MHPSDLLKEKVAKYSLEFLIDEVRKKSPSSKPFLWLGIGSGTTIKYFLTLLSKYQIEGSLPFTFVTISSSTDSELYCRELQLPTKQFGELPAGKKFDYYIDGADEVDPQKRCLKGLGGASTREKLLRNESTRFFVLVDETKKVSSLCTRTPIVVEILPFAFERTLERLKKLSPDVSKVDVRRGTGKMGYVITDNNNFLVDLYFKEALSSSFDLKTLERQVKLIPGAIESGLFADPADVVFIATKTTVEILK